MASRIEELFQDIAEEFAQGNRQEREYSRSEIDTSDLIKDDAMLLAGLGTAATFPYAGPAWLSNFASRATGPIINKAYGAVGGDMSKMFIPPLTKLGRRFRNQDTPLSSGARVGQDARREIIPPLTKIGQRTTNRGPRGNTNIDVPQQRQLPLGNARNTGGISDAEQAAIRSQQGIMNTPRGKTYLEEIGPARELERMNKRRNFLLTKTRYDESLIKANETPSKDFSKNLEELKRLEELLK